MPSLSYFEAADSAAYMKAARQEILETESYPFACSLVALDIANLLKRDGYASRLIVLTGRKVDSANTAPLTPLAFEGRVTWAAHMVCEMSGLIYDPLVSSYPQETPAYLATAYAEHPEIDEIIEGDKLDDLLSQ